MSKKEDLKKEIIDALLDSIDSTNNQVSIPTFSIILDELLKQ